MKIGVSSASLFPLHTEDAIAELGKRGVKHIEVFVNSAVELSGEICDKIKSHLREYDMKPISVHPFSSPMETLYLFAYYDRRTEEILDLYRRHFELMNEIGAEIFVVHGAITSSKVSDDFYFSQYLKLVELGNSFGIKVAQENICYCKSNSLEFLRNMSQKLGDNARFVLDLKQSVRSGLSPYDILDAVGNKVIHIHASDCKEGADCLPIGKGTFDFARLFKRLGELNYNGAMMVELYRSNYADYDELKASADALYAIERMAAKDNR